MPSIGVDLAWGERARTGLCALDEGGTVLGSTVAGTDDEIVQWCAPFLKEASVVVSIDAPLVVPNIAGRRLCESALSRCYGSRNAAPHSSNRSMAAFRRWRPRRAPGQAVGTRR